jgi:hypothetical protein
LYFRLSLDYHTHYVGVVEITSSPPLTEGQYGKIESNYPDGGHCQSVLRPQLCLTSPFIIINSVETAAPFNVVNHHDVVSQEINPWNYFNLLMGSNE